MERLVFISNIILVTFCANSFLLLKEKPWLVVFVVLGVIAANLMPLYTKEEMPVKRLYVCSHGVKCLGAFVISVTASVLFHIYLAVELNGENWLLFFFSALLCFLIEATLFWNGIISLYLSSLQLGIRTRVVGILLGYVPIANIFCLFHIIRTVRLECEFEKKKYEINSLRKEDKVCAVKYPVLLVHGVFFRDLKFLNYWGRIPRELEANGATIFYGEHQSALSVRESGMELAEKIRQIVNETGCEKVNIIAHSKGGLDSRYAIVKCGVKDCVASLTTISTPHRGCYFAEYLLTKMPVKLKDKTAKAYNEAMRRLGDQNPDFLAAVNDLLPDKCEAFDKELVIDGEIYTQSVGSVMKRARSGKFPMWFTYHLARHFDGENDGLVGTESFRFGERYIYIAPSGKRGISHADMVDMNRENIASFDVREFYVELVSELKERGL